MRNVTLDHSGNYDSSLTRRHTDTYPDCTNGFCLQMKGENVTLSIFSYPTRARGIIVKYNFRKDEELVRLLRPYDKQISINAMKKIGAPLLGLAKGCS